MENTPAPNQPDKVDPIQEITALKASLAERDEKLEKLSNGLQKLFREREETLSKKEQQPETEQQTERVTVAALSKQLKDRDEAEARRNIRDSVRTGLKSHGIDDEGVEILEGFVTQRDGKNFVYNDGKVFWKNPENRDDVQSIESYLEGVVKTKGERFKAPVQPPQARGLKASSVKTSNPGQTPFDMSADDRAKLSKSQYDALVRAEWSRYKQTGGK